MDRMTQTNNPTTPAADAAGSDTLTKAQVITLQREIGEAMQAIAAKHGLKMIKNNATWSAEGLRLTIALDKVTADGGSARWAADWKRYAVADGLPENGLGRSFSSGGMTYKVLGYDAKKRTRPVVAQGSDGKTYIFQAEAVALRLAKEVR